MKIAKILAVVLVVLLPVIAVLAPIGPLPGFFIGGTEVSPPAIWGETRGIHEVKLKVPGTLPRVVIIWVIQYEGDLFVVGNRTSGWVKMLGQGGPVLLRLEDQTYGLTATQLTTGWQPVLQAYVDKYRADYPDIVNGFPDVEEAAETIAVYRLAR